MGGVLAAIPLPLLGLPAALAALTAAVGALTAQGAQSTAQVAQHGVALAALTAQGAQLTAQVAQHGVALAALTAGLTTALTQIAISSARSCNSSASHDAHLLTPPPDQLGVLPGAAPVAVCFPLTRGDLEVGGELTNVRATALLAFYGLPDIVGNSAAAVRNKRRAIANHIGLRL